MHIRVHMHAHAPGCVRAPKTPPDTLATVFATNDRRESRDMSFGTTGRLSSLKFAAGAKLDVWLLTGSRRRPSLHHHIARAVWSENSCLHFFLI